jgi:hypothetical protein
MRDRDIRNSMRDQIMASGFFDHIGFGRDPLEWATGEPGARTCQIEPSKEQFIPLWDRSGEDGGVVQGEAVCTFTVQNEDPEMRDAMLEQMYNVAADVLNNIALPIGYGATVMPAFSWLDTLKWLPAAHPTRQGKAIYKYRYMVASSESMDITE